MPRSRAPPQRAQRARSNPGTAPPRRLSVSSGAFRPLMYPSVTVRLRGGDVTCDKHDESVVA